MMPRPHFFFLGRFAIAVEVGVVWVSALLPHHVIILVGGASVGLHTVVAELACTVKVHYLPERCGVRQRQPGVVAMGVASLWHELMTLGSLVDNAVMSVSLGGRRGGGATSRPYSTLQGSCGLLT